MVSVSSNQQFHRLLSLTKLLTSHVNNGFHDQALSLFRQLHSTLSLDPYVFPLALKSCTASNSPILGSSIHTHIIKSSLLHNPFVSSALINMYGKCVSISSAHHLFDEIPLKNVVVWNSMISLYAQSGDIPRALNLFETMNIAPNESSFNSIISNLDNESSVQFYRRMQSIKLKPNLITLLALLRSAMSTASLQMIQEIHSFSIRNRISSNPQLDSGLVEAYGRCGSIINSRIVFEHMTERDVVAWSSLISAYALDGDSETALKTFSEMETAKVKPDDITFLGVLKACSHAGKADEARLYFGRMKNDYGLEPNSDHYSCLVDAISRAGRIREAYEVVLNMPVKATAKAWGAILGACRTYGEEVEIAEIAGKALMEIEPDNAANFVLLGRIYASAGRYEEADRIRREMMEKGVKAAPGGSWIM
ncbi:putative pentatricopeptide repeat-containing protein At1g03510 [Impatiens glandulifera]|uniref:putative pentatricopeptide repeat-containing protein At1g03510 n=1 Tax=Impatiens glandulifera TaxID=253017 RepID=UPI001FB07A4D|nr:putative pentatricopeptide repeat-containing protein At1g03510 [Impatiens glandulifera]